MLPVEFGQFSSDYQKRDSDLAQLLRRRRRKESKTHWRSDIVAIHSRRMHSPQVRVASHGSIPGNSKEER